MAIQIVKEGQRMPGWNILSTPSSSPFLPPIIVAGAVMEIDPNDSSYSSARLLSGTSPLGIAIDSNIRSTITNGQPGVEYVTEYNRGGLISTSHGNGMVLRSHDDGLGNACVLSPANAAVWAVNAPIYTIKQGTTGNLTSIGMLTPDPNGSTNVLIGRVINVQGSGSTLSVTWISSI